MEPVAFRHPAKAITALVVSLLPGLAQTFVERQASPNVSQAAPQTLTLKDALELAQKNDPAYLSALNDAAIAQEDRAQARAAILPTFGARSEYLGTEGNGKLPASRFVTNDGVHVYRDWARASGSVARNLYANRRPAR